MAKRENLKRKLKASDRRRRRRAESAAQTGAATNSTAEPRVDVIGMIVGTILDYVDDSYTEVRDSTLVSAMRSCVEATPPSNDQSSELLARLEKIPAQPGVDLRAFRSALTQLLGMAKEHHDPKHASAFIRYLAMLAR